MQLLVYCFKVLSSCVPFLLSSNFDGNLSLPSIFADTYLWSGSTDKTIRVWDVTSSACIGTLTSSGGGPGHTAAVTCLTALPPTSAGAESYIASGGMDGEVKLWKTNGEAVYHVGHECEVTSVASFTPDNGGKYLEIFSFCIYI